MSMVLGLFSTIRCAVTETSVYSKEPTEIVDLYWDHLGFRWVPTDYMLTMKCIQNGIFTEGELIHYGQDKKKGKRS
ncbi:branched-chain amino acid aminotransferase 2, chloroplastic-like [Zingiber officinale]|uniref:branched-chain amino acid aminotransferase 2, chloroplastic-like n=1 Tax=Zingiber officinale TaxID=94328 RepID=UPI001C4AEA75|nr:branched-chain amino acid aminotransferase 2, chloroplastic-like [Zingiber officinale]